jgi:hypothetical protein
MLRDEGMIVKLNISAWTAWKFDKRVTDRVHSDYGAGRDAGRYNKALVAKEAMAEITKAKGAARTFHYEQSLPWEDGGGRLLPAANFNAYSKRMRELKRDFEVAVSTFLANYGDYREEARRRLNGMFNSADYPGANDIRGKFRFGFDIDPVPNGDDFRVNIQSREAARIAKQIDKRVAEREAVAMKSLFERLYDVIRHMSEKLRDADAVFRDSLVDNLVSLVALLPKLNIAQDDGLIQLTKEAKKLCVFEPQQLRDDSGAREKAADKADALLKKMAGYVG